MKTKTKLKRVKQDTATTDTLQPSFQTDSTTQYHTDVFEECGPHSSKTSIAHSCLYHSSCPLLILLNVKKKQKMPQ